MKVLFVDDEPNVLAGMRRMLRSHRKRWPMRFVEGGEQALQAMAEEPADLIVSDIRMPGMSGVQLLNAVRDRWPGTLRMVLSGESDPEALLKAVGPTHQYLCKPCRSEALVDALQRMDAMLQLVQERDLRSLAGSLDNLPTPSASFAQAMTLLNDPESTAADLASVLRADIGMSTAILRVANSAYVNSRSTVATVERAIQLLGLTLVRAILMVAGILREEAEHPGIHAILERSRVISRHVGHLARQEDVAVRQQAELAGMLHNLGALVMLQLEPDAYTAVLPLTGSERHDEERRLFGTTQATLGAYLLGVWGLPAPVMLAVANQDHAPEDLVGALLARALHPLEDVA